MKIFNRKDFLNLPDGVLFSDYKPVAFNGLRIKGRTIYSGLDAIDFIYEDLIGNVEFDSTEDFVKIMDKAEKGEKFDLDFFCGERDGLFDDSALYAVYSNSEIIELSEKIKSCKGVE